MLAAVAIALLLAVARTEASAACGSVDDITSSAIGTGAGFEVPVVNPAVNTKYFIANPTTVPNFAFTTSGVFLPHNGDGFASEGTQVGYIGAPVGANIVITSPTNWRDGNNYVFGFKVSRRANLAYRGFIVELRAGSASGTLLHTLTVSLVSDTNTLDPNFIAIGASRAYTINYSAGSSEDGSAIVIVLRGSTNSAHKQVNFDALTLSTQRTGLFPKPSPVDTPSRNRNPCSLSPPQTAHRARPSARPPTRLPARLPARRRRQPSSATPFQRS